MIWLPGSTGCYLREMWLYFVQMYSHCINHVEKMHKMKVFSVSLSSQAQTCLNVNWNRHERCKYTFFQSCKRPVTQKLQKTATNMQNCCTRGEKAAFWGRKSSFRTKVAESCHQHPTCRIVALVVKKLHFGGGNWVFAEKLQKNCHQHAEMWQNVAKSCIWGVEIEFSRRSCWKLPSTCRNVALVWQKLQFGGRNRACTQKLQKNCHQHAEM